MSKYTRSNKINHYHDSTKMRASARLASSSSFMTDSRIISKSNSNISSNRGSSNDSQCLELVEESGIDVEPNLMATSRSGETNRKLPPSRLKSTRAHPIYDYNSSSGCKPKQFAFFAFFILAMTLIVCFELKGVASLNCYHCSSVDNPDCDEPFTGRANFTDTDCEKHIGRPAKVCRKIVQYIEDKKVVIRSCGYIDEHEGKDQKAMCYKRSGTFAIMMESCNCYEDNCNHSASLVPSKNLLLTLVSGLLIYLIVIGCLSK